MRKLAGNTYYCSSCEKKMHAYQKKCSSCGEDAITEIIKDKDSVLDIFYCNHCNERVLKDDKKCSKCTNDFRGVFYKCVNCSRLLELDKELCVCGYFAKRLDISVEKTSDDLNDSDSESKEKPIKTNWLSFYNYLLMPLGFIMLVIATLLNSDSMALIIINAIIGLSFLYVAYSIHMRYSWAYYAYIILIIVGSIDYIYTRVYLQSIVDHSIDFLATLLTLFIFISLFWIAPNIIYIKKRKHLFINNSSNVFHNQNKTQTIEKINTTTSVDDDLNEFNKLEKLSELKEKGVISEEEFESKKKEILDRI